MWRTCFLAIAAAVLMPDPAPAQTPEEDTRRGVARISLIQGDVSVQRADTGDLIAGSVNAPLVAGDSLITGPAARAELQFDWSNMLRVSAESEVRLTEVGQERFLIQHARGLITWRVLRDQDAYAEISTPGVSVRAVKRGIYRITVSEDGSSQVTVREGEAEIYTPRGSERVLAGRTVIARGLAADPDLRSVSALPEDEWDRWSQLRDRDLLRTESYNYISRDIYGADDLDNYGRWVNVPTYGWAWSPQVASGWAPYRDGRWSWVDWYGWSWISYDPWGWAPYHYGRWVNQGSHGWLWIPGRPGTRHRWAPAYVAFFGFNGGSAGWGRIGWVPLGPYEPFYPWWGSRWYGYGGGVHIDNSRTVVNNVNIRQVYRNARIDNAITVVDGDGFRRGRSGGYSRYTDGDLQAAAIARGPVPVAPARGSARFTDRESGVPAAPPRGVSRPDRFFSNRQPQSVDRVPFENQRQTMEDYARRSYTAPAQQVAAPSPVSPAAEQSLPSAVRREETQRGWQRRGEAAPPGPEPAGEASGADDGWTRFGGYRSSPPQPSPRRGATVDDGYRRFGGGRRSPDFPQQPAPQPQPEPSPAAPSRSSSQPRQPQVGPPRVEPRMVDTPGSEPSRGGPDRGGRSFGAPPQAPPASAPPPAAAPARGASEGGRGSSGGRGR